MGVRYTTVVLVVLMAGAVRANETQWRQLGSAGSLYRGRSEIQQRRMAITTTAVAQVNHVAHHLRNSTTFIGAFSRRLAKKAAKQAASDPQQGRYARDLTRLCRSLGRLAAIFEGRAAAMDHYVRGHPPTTRGELQLLERDIDRILGAVKGIGTKLIGTTSKLRRLVRNEQGDQHSAELLHQSALRVLQLGSVVRRLERAAVMPGLTPTNVAALAREAIAGYAGRAVSIQFSGARRATAVVSPRRIRQALAELLDNSLEAIGEQGATRGVIKVTVKSDKNRVLLSVQDTGGGIPKNCSLIEGLGQPFISSKPDRFGLGLARVAEIAKAHGGSACLGNDPGHGVTVLISLPRTGP